MGTSTDAYLYFGLDVMDEDSGFIPPKLRKCRDVEERVKLLQKVAKKHNLKVDSHGMSDYPIYYLHAKCYFAYRGCPKKVSSLNIGSDWNKKLISAAKELGIEEPEKKIGWWLASYWG